MCATYRRRRGSSPARSNPDHCTSCGRVIRLWMVCIDSVAPTGHRAFRVSTTSNRGWIKIWLTSDVLQWWLMRNAREAARKTLNLSELTATQVALPPLDEHREIVARVSAIFLLGDRLEIKLSPARSRLESFSESALTKALRNADDHFRGKFVFQDPSDESASSLLSREVAEPWRDYGCTAGEGSIESRPSCMVDIAGSDRVDDLSLFGRGDRI